ncbi:MAG: hypothetical protein K6T17_04270, partial [Fimbriimonadales bacterium]|nr:hypothetical protein [Fimbriimonadales bacterium]
MSEKFNWENLFQSKPSSHELHTSPEWQEKETPAAITDSEIRDIESAHIEDLLRLCVERRGSDLHLTVGLPPTIRLDGELVQLPYRELTPRDTQRLLYDIMSDQQITRFEQTRELDFSYGVKGLGRFRVNVYMQRDSLGA